MTQDVRSLLLDRDACLLLIVDMQERLMPAVLDPDKAAAKAALMLKAAARLGVPIIASEQYPQGIGPTRQDIARLLPADSVISKIHFSCVAEEEFGRRLADLDRNQIVIAGTEAHVCVQQTALDLASAGYDVFIALDATASRRELDRSLAQARMSAAGITMVSAEMVVFEWLRRADSTDFRELLALIKSV